MGVTMNKEIGYKKSMNKDSTYLYNYLKNKYLFMINLILELERLILY